MNAIALVMIVRDEARNKRDVAACGAAAAEGGGIHPPIEDLVDVDEQEAVSIPGNVSSLLGARLDRLRPAERRVVESASVIGLEFSSDAVSALLGESDTPTDLETTRQILAKS